MAVCIKVAMDRKPKYVAQIDNVYLVRRIGASLREATADTVRDKLPENIRLLLRRLQRLEARKSRQEVNRLAVGEFAEVKSVTIQELVLPLCDGDFSFPMPKGVR